MGLNNRFDFVYIFDVQDGNPNGDPDAGNLPRVDAETGMGLVTDVCLKRKVRNYVLTAKECASRYDIYVKEKAVLGRAHYAAFKDLGFETGEESVKIIPDELLEEIETISFCEGIETRINDDSKSLAVLSTADKEDIKNWIKDSHISKGLQKFVQSVLKDAKPRKPTAEETEKGRKKMCEKFYDIRTFGAVMSLKSAPNCGQVRGPIQLTFARSVDSVTSLEHSITRMAVATEAEAAKQKGDNRTMGRKSTIPYGLYVCHGFISPNLANQTGFSEEDLELFWEALKNMFDVDRSAARGLMSAQKLIVFKHSTKLGNAPANKLFDLVKVEKNADCQVPRSFGDYIVAIDRDNLPENVEIIEML